MSDSSNWVTVCANDDLIVDTGLCALHEGEQVAIFKVSQTGEVFALQNFDPIGKANVLSRGLLASSGDDTYIVSPLYKQHFCLQTGACLEDENFQLKVFPVRLFSDQIQLKKAV
jgi:nitrite reductase (NADH) small subunit